MASELGYAIARVVEAQADRDKARRDCDASWGYFWYEYERRLDEAVSSLENEIRQLIRDEVRAMNESDKNQVRAPGDTPNRA